MTWTFPNMHGFCQGCILVSCFQNPKYTPRPCNMLLRCGVCNVSVNACGKRRRVKHTLGSNSICNQAKVACMCVCEQGNCSMLQATSHPYT